MSRPQSKLNNKPNLTPVPNNTGEAPLDGIDLLLKMAQTGQIDPWNVDIVEVADQYLRAVAELRESDLKRTGKTLLYLAILLRMKSDQLAGINFLDVIEDASWDDFGEAPGESLMLIDPFPSNPLFSSLEDAIKRRTNIKQPRIRPVTLEDLIRELRKYEEIEKKRTLREKVEKASNRHVADYSQLTSDDIEDLAHEEFLEDSIFILKELLERIFIKEESISLSEIHRNGIMDKISAFISLLFLESRGEVEIFQLEFYGELFVRKAPPLGEVQASPEDNPTDQGITDDTIELAG